MFQFHQWREEFLSKQLKIEGGCPDLVLAQVRSIANVAFAVGKLTLNESSSRVAEPVSVLKSASTFIGKTRF